VCGYNYEEQGAVGIGREAGEFRQFFIKTLLPPELFSVGTKRGILAKKTSIIFIFHLTISSKVLC